MCFDTCCVFFFFFQAEDGIRDTSVTGVQTCALPICRAVRDRRELIPAQVHVALDGRVQLHPRLEHIRAVACGELTLEVRRRSEERRVGKECRWAWVEER